MIEGRMSRVVICISIGMGMVYRLSGALDLCRSIY